MILFALLTYKDLASRLQQIPGLERGSFSLRRFRSHEIRVTIETVVEGKDCLVLGSLTPPDEYLLATLLLCHTLKKERAARVVTLFPYLAYMRQDTGAHAESAGAAWAGALLRASGVDQVVTVDIHSQLARDAIALPVVSLSPATVFAKEIAKDWIFLS